MSRAMLATGVLLALLAGCGERDQSLATSANRSDGKAWEGANNAYVAKGWTPGDRSSWETQLRSRAQNQNENLKTN